MFWIKFLGEITKYYLQPMSSTKKVLGLGQDLSTGRIGYWGLFIAAHLQAPAFEPGRLPVPALPIMVIRSSCRSVESSTRNRSIPNRSCIGGRCIWRFRSPRRCIESSSPDSSSASRSRKTLQLGSTLGLVAFGCLEAGEPWVRFLT